MTKKDILGFCLFSHTFSRVFGRDCSYLVAKSCPTLLLAHGLAHPLSMGFSRQEYWSELPFPSPGDLPNSGIKLTSPAWQADSLPLSHLGSPLDCEQHI